MPTIRSSFAGFTTAQLGMSASQAAMNVAGQNISNVNTKGYTRQRVDLDSFNVFTGPTQWGGVNQTFIGNGVLTNRIEQVRDPYLDLRFRTEMAGVGYYDKTLAGLQDLQSTLDEVDKEGSIHNQLEAIFKALNEFNPQAANNEFQNMAKTELQLLTQYFNSYSNAIKQTKEDNMTEFKDQTIPAVNQLLVDITHLNKSIKENEILGNPALELRDERNLLLDELSKYVKIEVTYEEKYVGLSSQTAHECTVKMLGVDEKGNPFRYTLIDHDKAAEFQINDDCSKLTMTDINGSPISNIGSALKPDGGTVGEFADGVAKTTELLGKIKDASTDMYNLLTQINQGNKKVSSLNAQIVNLSKNGADLLKDLKTQMRGREGVITSIKNYQDQIDELDENYKNITNPTDKQKAQYEAQSEELQAKLKDRQRVLKIYNERIFGESATVSPEDTTTFDATFINGLANNTTDTGIYNKLLKIYGDVDGAKTTDFTSPKFETPATKGALQEAKQDLEDAIKDVEGLRKDYVDAETTLKESVEELKKYVDINPDYETYPIDGTNFFISLPTITINGTSAKDGYGITLFDPNSFVPKQDGSGKVDVGKVAKIEIKDIPDPNDPNATVDGIVITDPKGATHTDLLSEVDGTRYSATEKDDDGNPLLDMDELRNLYDCMQEDNGSIKAALDLFNRAGEFNGSTDRGYDYYLNMLDVFARQIAKVFNDANTKNVDGSPLLDSNGKPIEYANALFGADGEIPTKYMTNTTGTGGKYLSDYTTGATTDDPSKAVPDVFKTDDNGYLLNAKGEQVLDANNKPIALKDVDVMNDPNVLLDESALAAYGIVKSQEAAHPAPDGSGNTVEPGDWVDKDGNPLLVNGNKMGPNIDKATILQNIQDGTFETIPGKVPKIDYDQITASNFTITQDWADAKTHFVQTHDPSQTAGYNDNINHLIAVFGEKLDYTFTQEDGTQKTVFNGTFVEFYDNMGNQLGLDIKSSTILANNAISITNDLANNRDAISGVSLDEEGIDILKYQKAFTASARVMTALDEILDKVINGMGVVGR